MIRKTGEERTKLETVIPLNTPFVIHIETTNVCNFKCKFCCFSDDLLMDKYGIEKGFMDYNLFCKIIDDMKEFPKKVKQIIFHVSGEPLVQRDIVKMISYAKQGAVADSLVLFTNASLLTPKMSRDIMSAGIDLIQISIEALNDRKYKEITGVEVRYNSIVGNVAYLYACKSDKCLLYVKILDIGLSENEKKQFYDDFYPISSKCYIEHLISTLPSDIKDTTLGMGQSVTTDGYEIESKEVCTIPFYILAVNCNGTVSACVCDWSRRLIMGDVTSESLVDIWNGKKYAALRRLQLQMKRQNCEACRECQAIKNQIDNIDMYAPELLAKL